MARVWLVTGTSRGLGRSIAEAVLKHGDKLVATARKPEQLDDLKAQYGDNILPLALDVRDRESLEQPFITHNPDLMAILSPQLEAIFQEQLTQKSLAEQVQVMLKRLPAGQRASIHEVAAELNMSVRTLQRQLAATGASYQQLLDEVRHSMARHYLGQSSLDLIEIAYLLGYEETNSFHRAFQQWEGVPPGQWRNTLSHSVS